MEQTRQDVHVGAVERYLRRGEVQPHQAEHLRRVVAEASRTGEPIELHVHLPAEPQQVQAVKERRDIDWTFIAVIGIPALLVLVLASFIFVGCMSQPPPPPAPNVTTNPSCSSWCW